MIPLFKGCEVGLILGPEMTLYLSPDKHESNESRRNTTLLPSKRITLSTHVKPDRQFVWDVTTSKVSIVNRIVL